MACYCECGVLSGIVLDNRQHAITASTGEVYSAVLDVGEVFSETDGLGTYWSLDLVSLTSVSRAVRLVCRVVIDAWRVFWAILLLVDGGICGLCLSS